MKEMLTQYAQYNTWANKLVIDTILALPTSVVKLEMMSSFPTIHATATHIMAAEETWLQRLQRVPQPTWRGSFTGPFNEVCSGWEKASQDMEQYITTQDDASLSTTCQYKDRSGNAYSTPVWQILQHVFNHSTYHRGQLITMLRTAGATQMTSTDFIGFVRIGR